MEPIIALVGIVVLAPSPAWWITLVVTAFNFGGRQLRSAPYEGAPVKVTVQPKARDAAL